MYQSDVVSKEASYAGGYKSSKVRRLDATEGDLTELGERQLAVRQLGVLPLFLGKCGSSPVASGILDSASSRKAIR
eukprot:CAMPEP_0181448228 /NCGR_PEP_ID=MMETSP1110-20121109/27031_1 /TAXON_ID=174948 /ORGANISM="Symbiodinium sp., Strain CCMP421" /LENGTH=75 /DNA_ID=CAMNT_0023572369 /DNA_START=112 /DNA_END=339 /DNA_ORIENTATION=+